MRLIDITVHEVSLVDKAANKKKFAFMKRETVEDVKKEAVKEEVKEAAQVIKETAEVKTEVKVETPKYTPEQIAEATALNAEVIELVAQLKTRKQ